MNGEHFTDDGYPLQRIRVALGAFVFFVFEMTIGRQLPTAMTYMVLGLGVVSLISAMMSMRVYRLQAQVVTVRSSMRRRPRR